LRPPLALDVYYGMLDSTEANPEWRRRESLEIARRSHILSSTGQEISEMLASSFESRSRSLDETMPKVSNSIRGTVDLFNLETGGALWQQDQTGRWRPRATRRRASSVANDPDLPQTLGVDADDDLFRARRSAAPRRRRRRRAPPPPVRG